MTQSNLENAGVGQAENHNPNSVPIIPTDPPRFVRQNVRIGHDPGSFTILGHECTDQPDPIHIPVERDGVVP